MKMHAIAVTLALGVLVITPALSQSPAGAAKSAPLVHAAEAATGKPTAAQYGAGESTYKAACLACHQAEGQGFDYFLNLFNISPKRSPKVTLIP